jgi:hypothetical protein
VWWHTTTLQENNSHTILSSLRKKEQQQQQNLKMNKTAKGKVRKEREKRRIKRGVAWEKK